MFANTLSNEEKTKIKVVDLDEFKNFYIHEFYIWNHILFWNVVSSCYFWNSNFESFKKVTWQGDQNKSCTSWWVIQL